MKQVLLRRFCALVLAGVLSACGTTENPQATSEAKPVLIHETAANADVKEAESVVAKLPDPKEQSEPEKPEVELIIPPVDVLKGKTSAEITDIFGAPTLLRKDKPAEVWQYLTGHCALHLVFYPEDDSDIMRVTYFAMNDRKAAEQVGVKSCFKSQLQRVGLEKIKALS